MSFKSKLQTESISLAQKDTSQIVLKELLQTSSSSTKASEFEGFHDT